MDITKEDFAEKDNTNQIMDIQRHKEKKMDVKQNRRRDDKAVLAESLVAPEDDDDE